MDLTGRRLMLVGGAGLIGSHIVDKLAGMDVAEVVVFDNFVRGSRDNLASALRHPKVRVVEGSIADRAALGRAMQGIDGIFLLASLWLGECVNDPRSAWEVNTIGTWNVIEAAREAGVARIVYSSSASVYGNAVVTPMTEEHPFNNKNFYGATKICGEAMARAYHFRYGLDFVGLRYMNVYGPRQDYRGAYIAVIMKMLDAIDRGEGPTILGDGSEAFDFVAVEDCALANICAMKSTSTDNFYNVGTGKRTSLKEIAEKLLRLTGSNQPIKYAPRSQATLVRNRIGSPKKATKDIGFTAKIDLDEGLQRLIEWRASHKAEVDARRLKAAS